VNARKRRLFGYLDLRRSPLTPDPQTDAISHAMAMVAVPVVFGAVGWWIDSRIGTSPVLLLALAAFGIAGSFLSAFYRYEARIARLDEGKPWTRRIS
jgi:F0F1-type ATP synthase assembly protein I